MTKTEFLDAYDKIRHQCIKLIPELAKTQLDDRERQRCRFDDFKICNIDDNGIQLSQEYNDACHCHPEMRPAYINIPWNKINLE